MELGVLVEFAAVEKRTNLNDYDKKFLASCRRRIFEGVDLTDKQIELLHRMVPRCRFPEKETVQRVGYTVIEHKTGRKIHL